MKFDKAKIKSAFIKFNDKLNAGGDKFVNKTLAYAKNNPRDFAYDLGAVLITALLLDMENWLESIEGSSEVSAAVDVLTFEDGGR